MSEVSRGSNLVDAIAIARRLGCAVAPVHRTGEVRFTHPALDRSIKVNARRKSAPRALTAWLRKIDRARR